MATQYPFTVPGHENHAFVFQPNGFTAKIFMDGAPMKSKGTKFTGTLMSGEEIVLGLKYGIDILNPKLVYKGQTLTVIPALSKWQMILIYLPLFLVVSGGAVGGLFGALSAYFNNSTIRGNSPGALKVILCLMSTFAAFFLYAVCAGLIRSSIK